MTSLPSRWTKIFFPLLQTWPSPVTTCVPLTVVSTWDHPYLATDSWFNFNKGGSPGADPLGAISKWLVDRPEHLPSLTYILTPGGISNSHLQVDFLCQSSSLPVPIQEGREPHHSPCKLDIVQMCHKTESLLCKCPLPILPSPSEFKCLSVASSQNFKVSISLSPTWVPLGIQTADCVHRLGWEFHQLWPCLWLCTPVVGFKGRLWECILSGTFKSMINQWLIITFIGMPWSDYQFFAIQG